MSYQIIYCIKFNCYFYNKMLIKLNPITKIFNTLALSTARNNKFITVRKTSHVIKEEYSFCNRKN